MTTMPNQCNCYSHYRDHLHVSQIVLIAEQWCNPNNEKAELVTSHRLNVVKEMRNCFFTKKESGSRDCMVLVGFHAVPSVVSSCP